MSDKPSILDCADKSVGSLNYAVDLQKAAANVGFDWPEISGVIEKIHEELNEVLDELKTENNHHRLTDEVGDLLFACTNLARHLNVDPEQALQAGNAKFSRRFKLVEREVRLQGYTFEQCSLHYLDTLWHHVKQAE